MKNRGFGEMMKEYWEVPEPNEDPCESCKSLNCVNVCFSRMRWWDATIDKIRAKVAMESLFDMAMRKEKEGKTFE